MKIKYPQEGKCPRCNEKLLRIIEDTTRQGWYCERCEESLDDKEVMEVPLDRTQKGIESKPQNSPKKKEIGMYEFSDKSQERLLKADVGLILIFKKLIQIFDCTILESYRDEATQEKMFVENKSKLHWPHSNHNLIPSRAIDVAPYPIDWSNKVRFYYMAGMVKYIAHDIGIVIRWGGDWNSNDDFSDQLFDDLPHFELR